MKRTSTYITIPKPCHERWDHMTATDRGAFCKSCQNEVIDFSAMTNREVIEYLETHGAGCGRFRKDQLDTKLSMPKVGNGLWGWRTLVLSLLPMLSMENVHAREALPVSQNHVNDRLAPDTIAVSHQSDSIQISGRIINVIGGKEEGMIGAAVFIENKLTQKTTGVATDANGNFTFILDKSTIKRGLHTLKIRYTGYLEKSIPISDEPVQYYTIKYDEKDEVVLGGMEPIIIYRHHKGPGPKIKYWFRHLFKKNKKQLMTGRY